MNGVKGSHDDGEGNDTSKPRLKVIARAWRITHALTLIILRRRLVSDQSAMECKQLHPPLLHCNNLSLYVSVHLIFFDFIYIIISNACPAVKVISDATAQCHALMTQNVSERRVSRLLNGRTRICHAGEPSLSFFIGPRGGR